MTSEPPDRGFDGPKFRNVIASTCSMDALDAVMPLLPVRLPPSMMPPEMEIRVCEPDAVAIAALAVVEELI